MTEREIFAEALELEDAAQRAAFLSRACGSDPALRGRIEGLLAEQATLGSFLQAPAAVIELEPPAKIEPGRWIGRYRLVEEIGAGGMGTVWAAEQTEPVKRRVALKLIKPGMDSRQVASRFEVERQALALMDHPNIAKVYDGGMTDQGRPYFVMEYVQGVPLTDYCDSRQLSVRERLELFVPVCQAVQHAHQKGIIHRDLKPSNILVCDGDGRPVPKIIDFGLAKAMNQRLTEHTLYTAQGLMIGTPLYMSPEQADPGNADIDTRADIYSLGAILYELSTGTPPVEKERFKDAGLAETLRLVKEEEPEAIGRRLAHTLARRRQSTQIAEQAKRQNTACQTQSGASPPPAGRMSHLQAEIPNHKLRELDWIIRKALEKDRSRRYQTVNGLARDIERYLHDEPVEAGPPSGMYRLTKLVRRYRAAVAATSVTLVFLLLATAVSLWHAVRATRAERAARASEETARQAQAAEHAAELKALEAAAAESRARHQQTEQLWQSLLQQAQAERWSGRAGRRFDALKALAEAATIARDLKMPQERFLQLRNEAIAALSLVDVRVGKTWEAYPQGWAGISFDRDLARYARSDDKGNLSIRRVDEDQEIMALPGPGVHAWDLQFSPGGELLAAGYLHPGGLKELWVWDLKRRDTAMELDKGVFQNGIGFSPDGDRLALGLRDGAVGIYDPRSGTQQQRLAGALRPSSTRSLRFDPHGGKLAIAAPQAPGAELHDLESGRRTVLPHPAGGAWGLEWRPDGNVLATAADDGKVYLWELNNPRQPARILDGHQAAAVRVAFTRDGALLASQGWDDTTRLWDPLTGRLLVTTPGSSSLMLQFSADGRTLASGRHAAQLWLWEVAAGRECRTFRDFRSRPRMLTVGTAAIDPGGRLLAWAGTGGIGLWSLDAAGHSAYALYPLPNPAVSVHFHPHGKSLIAGTTAGLYRLPLECDLEAGIVRIGPPSTLLTGHAGHAVLSPDGRKIVVDRGGGRAVAFELDNPGHQATFASERLGFPAISADRRWVATGTWQGKGAKLWDAETGKPMLDFAVGDTAQVGFSPDGRWLVTSDPQEYRFWDVSTGEPGLRVARQFVGNTGGSVLFSCDGRMLAIASSTTAVRLIDSSSGRELATLPTTGQALCFSRDGGLLGTGVENSAVQVWDLRLIRQQLREMGLDWDLPPIEDPSSEQRPLRKPLKFELHVAN